MVMEKREPQNRIDRVEMRKIYCTSKFSRFYGDMYTKYIKIYVLYIHFVQFYIGKRGVLSWGCIPKSIQLLKDITFWNFFTRNRFISLLCTLHNIKKKQILFLRKEIYRMISKFNYVIGFKARVSFFDVGSMFAMFSVF